MNRAAQHVVRLPLVNRLVGSFLLMAPPVTLARAFADPTTFSANGAPVTVQWVVSSAMSVLALLVLIAMWRSRIVVEPHRITRYRGLRAPVMVTQDAAWSITVEPDPTRSDVAQTFETADEPAPTIVVVGGTGQAIRSDRNRAEARVLFPYLLGWTAENPKLMTDQVTRQMLAAYERALTGRPQASPYA